MIWSVVPGVPLPLSFRVTVNSSSVPSLKVASNGNTPFSPFLFASLIAIRSSGSTTTSVDGIFFQSLSTASTLPKMRPLSCVRSGASIP